MMPRRNTKWWALAGAFIFLTAHANVARAADEAFVASATCDAVVLGTCNGAWYGLDPNGYWYSYGNAAYDPDGNFLYMEGVTIADLGSVVAVREFTTNTLQANELWVHTSTDGVNWSIQMHIDGPHGNPQYNNLNFINGVPIALFQPQLRARYVRFTVRVYWNAYVGLARTHLTVEPPFPRTWWSWIGPMPFISGATVRSDFHNVWDVPSTWSQIKTQTEVFKTYLNVLQNPAWGQAGLTDAEVAGFVQATRGKQIAFEVGGLRPYWCPDPPPGSEHPDVPFSQCVPINGGCTDRLGEGNWDAEYQLLRRWIEAGGQINYLTTDHALFFSYFQKNSFGESPCPDMTRAQLVKELVDYFVQARRTLGSGVKFGVIESLGMWRIGSYWPCGFDPSNPPCVREVVDLGVFLDELQDAAATATLGPFSYPVTIDHFHIDFGYEGVKGDGGDVLDYGRILGAENAARTRGIKAGIIANAYHDESIPSSDIAARRISARDRTIAFLQGYFKTTGAPDSIIFQQWQPYPDELGSEDDTTYTSSLGLIYASLFHWATPGWLPVGEYRVLPGSTIIKVTSSSTYCQWVSWDDYLTAHGGNGDLSWMTGYGSRPRDMTNTGACAP
jgi:hypothetical protein